MSLKIVPEPSAAHTATSSSARALAPGAPMSPGPAPDQLRERLDRGEALIWWNQKTSINWMLPLTTLAICLVLLASITMLAPTFWARSPLDFWGPVAAMLVPAAFLALREWLSRGQWMVTDRRIVSIDWRGYGHSIPFRSVREVKRDLWTGGVKLQGPDRAVVVAPGITKDARAAVALQLRSKVLGSGDKAPVDHVGGWFPKRR